MFTKANLFVLGSSFCVLCTFLFVVVWLSVSVQLIAQKTRLQNHLLCVELDVKPHTLTHSLTPDERFFTAIYLSDNQLTLS